MTTTAATHTHENPNDPMETLFCHPEASFSLSCVKSLEFDEDGAWMTSFDDDKVPLDRKATIALLEALGRALGKAG